MHVTFDPLNPKEADAVRTLLNLPAAAPALAVAEALAQPASVALLSSPPTVSAPEEVTLTPEAPPAAPTPAKSHKKKAAAAPAPAAETPPAVAAPEAPTLGHLLAGTPEGAGMVAAAAPAVSAPPAAGTPAKAPTVEDVRAAYRDLFAVIGEEPGKAELRAVLAKAGAATVSDLKADTFAGVIRSLNAATIVAKSKAAQPAAAAPKADPLL